MLDDGPRDVAGAAAGEHEDLTEDLKRADHVRDHDEQQNWAQERQRDRPERPPATGAVERGRLVQLARNVLKARQVHDQVVARHPPDGGGDDRPHRCRRIGQPRACRHAEGAQIVVERADDGIEQPEPCEPDSDHRQREREEEDAAQHVAERAAIERECQEQRHREDRQRARDRVEGGVPEADGEARVVGEPRVVREADVLIGRAPHPRVGERQPQAFEQRIEAKDREQQEAGQQEQIGRPRLPATATRHAQSGSALIWRASSSIATFAGFCAV